MFVRAVRFTDVDASRLEEVRTRIESSGGPPEGVTATGIQVLFDADQRTALVLQKFSTAEDLRSSEAVFEAMDPGQTPGARSSVDRCEVTLDLSA